MKLKTHKECKVCGKLFKLYRTTDIVCSTKCAIIEGRRKLAKKERREWEKENDDKKNQKLLQSSINLLARIIDFGQPCLAKGNFPKQMHGGHIFSRGSASNMRFNLHNIHRQSAQSNHFQNEDGLLRQNLKLEFGEQYYESLDSFHQTPIIKYTPSEFYDFYLLSNKIGREYKKMISEPLPVLERIRLRNEANLRLGIYPDKYCVINSI